MNLIERHRDSIVAICSELGVKTLSVFGSVARGEAREGSDVDLIVDFTTSDPLDYADKYFKLSDFLSATFNKKVDLLEHRGLKNRLLIEEINQSKVQIYAV